MIRFLMALAIACAVPAVSEAQCANGKCQIRPLRTAGKVVAAAVAVPVRAVHAVQCATCDSCCCQKGAAQGVKCKAQAGCTLGEAGVRRCRWRRVAIVPRRTARLCKCGCNCCG
jgi:hypothetical protein